MLLFMCEVVFLVMLLVLSMFLMLLPQDDIVRGMGGRGGGGGRGERGEGKGGVWQSQMLGGETSLMCLVNLGWTVGRHLFYSTLKTHTPNFGVENFTPNLGVWAVRGGHLRDGKLSKRKRGEATLRFWL